MKNLPSDKASPEENPLNVLKNSEICFFELTNYIIEGIRNNKFPDNLKLSDILEKFLTL